MIKLNTIFFDGSPMEVSELSYVSHNSTLHKFIINDVIPLIEDKIQDVKYKLDPDFINDDIEITILESKFDYCKIAINAPKSVKIYREEVYKQIQFANRLSNKTSADSIDSIDSLSALVETSPKEQKEVTEKLNKIIIKKKD